MVLPEPCCVFQTAYQCLIRSRCFSDAPQSKLAECELRNTPALFVIGSNSLWSPLAEMERVRRQTPGSTLLVIPGADDALQAEYKFMRMGTTQDLCDHKAAAEIGV
jgi:pimeloyl-ACP methyl ester carboxylesterase